MAMFADLLHTMLNKEWYFDGTSPGSKLFALG